MDNEDKYFWETIFIIAGTLFSILGAVLYFSTSLTASVLFWSLCSGCYMIAHSLKER